MALANFLGTLGSAMGGQQPGVFPVGPIGRPMADVPFPQQVPQQMQPGMPGQPAMPQQQRRENPARKKGVRHFLGVLGDALLTGAGGEPIYGPSVERAEMGEALAGYLGGTDEALAEIMRRDPATGFALLKMKMESAPEAQSPTALQQNIEYLRRLNPGMSDEQLAEVAQYAIAAPRMYGSPEMGWQPDPNYPFARGGGSEDTPAGDIPAVSDEATYAAIPPGAQYRDPDGNIRTKPGDAGGNASGGFLR